MVEQYNQTLKHKIFNSFLQNKNKKWLVGLASYGENINTTKQSATKEAPIEIKKDIAPELQDKVDHKTQLIWNKGRCKRNFWLCSWRWRVFDPLFGILKGVFLKSVFTLIGRGFSFKPTTNLLTTVETNILFQPCGTRDASVTGKLLLLLFWP